MITDSEFKATSDGTKKEKSPIRPNSQNSEFRNKMRRSSDNKTRKKRIFEFEGAEI